MIAFIFVSIVCIGENCEFLSSTVPINESRCSEMKRVFLSAPFKEEVTMAAAQCMKFENTKKEKIEYE